MSHRPQDRVEELAFPSLWAERHRVIQGRPWSFEGREYLRDIHDDLSEEVVVQKAAQLGFTEFLQNRACHAIDSGRSTIYCLPTSEDVKRHSKTRFNALKDQSPYIDSMFIDTDTIDVKRCGDAALYFFGTIGKTELYGTPADELIVDEVDRCDQDALSTARHRLDGSSKGARSLWVSTPTRPGVGVDVLIKQSDQKEWHVQCPSCDWSGPLDGSGDLEKWTCLWWKGWPKIPEPQDIVQVSDTACVRCPGCGAKWTEDERRAACSAGKWVARLPENASVSGYIITQLVSPTMTTQKIVREFFNARHSPNPHRMEEFVNQTMGKTFKGVGGGISEADVFAAYRQERPSGDLQWCLGVDVGHRKLYCCQGTRIRDGYKQVLWVDRFFVLEGFDWSMTQDKRGHIVSCVIDQYPETAKTEELCSEFGGSVYRARFGDGLGRAYRWNHEDYTVTVGRVEAIDAMHHGIREGRTWIGQGTDSDLGAASKHLTRVITYYSSDNTGQARRKADSKVGGADDYAFAQMGLEAAVTRLAEEREVSWDVPEEDLEPSYASFEDDKDPLGGMTDVLGDRFDSEKEWLRW